MINQIHQLALCVFLVLILTGTSQQYSCIDGFAYNSTYSSCMPTSVICPQYSTWNNQYCTYSLSCPSNTVSNGTACIPYTNNCPTGYFGSPKQCFKCPTGFVQYYNSVQCTINFGNCTAGNYWTGTACTQINTIPAQTKNNPILPILQSSSQKLDQNINSKASPIPTFINLTPITILSSNSSYPINQPDKQSTKFASEPVTCISGYYWTGVTCMPYNGTHICISSFFWNGTHCSNTSSSNIKEEQKVNDCNDPKSLNSKDCNSDQKKIPCTSGFVYSPNMLACVALPQTQFTNSKPLENSPLFQIQTNSLNQPPPNVSKQFINFSCDEPYYFDGTKCVTQNQQPKCISNFTFNKISNKCQPDVKTSSFCNPQFYWNGASCIFNNGQIVCLAGYTSNGSSCIPNKMTQGPQNCNSTTFWNGVSCITFNGYINCSVGYSWNGSQCFISSTPNCSNGFVINPVNNMCASATQSFCSDKKYWNGESCVANQIIFNCITSFYYNGVNCVPTTGYFNALNSKISTLALKR